MKAPKKIKIERIKKLKWQTDVVHNSVWLKKLINKIMLNGKKAVIEKIVYKMIFDLKSKFKKNPVALIDKIILLARPIFLFVVKRVFSKNHQIPVPIHFRRQIITSFSWFIDSILNRKENKLGLKLFNELSSFLQNKETTLFIKRNKHYDSISENRINMRYRWV